jgi:hypothetical protein
MIREVCRVFEEVDLNLDQALSMSESRSARNNLAPYYHEVLTGRAPVLRPHQGN